MAKKSNTNNAPRPVLPSAIADEMDHHASRGFRLTPATAAEMVGAILLTIGGAILLLLAFLNWRFNSTLHDAIASHMQRDIDEAPGKAKTAAEINPRFIQAQLLLGASALQAGDFALATETYSRIQDFSGEFPEVAIGLAAALLSDPKTANHEASRAQAEDRLRAAASDPIASIVLGQLALERGDFTRAEKLFRDGTAGDPPPTAAAFAVAHNGIGVCLINRHRAGIRSDDVFAAAKEFHTAIAYRQAWSPPFVNRDRAVAIYWRAIVRERESDADAILSAIERARDEFGLRQLDVESPAPDLRLIASEVQWPKPLTISAQTPNGLVPMDIGKLDIGALTDNRRRYVFNAMAIAQSHAVPRRVTQNGFLLAANSATRLQHAGQNDETFVAARYNEITNAMRGYIVAPEKLIRHQMLTSSAVKALQTLVENLEAIPEAERAPLLVAYYLVIAEIPERIGRRDTDNARGMAAFLTDSKWLEKIRQAGGTRQPSAEWFAFQQANIDAVQTFYAVDSRVGLDKMDSVAQIDVGRNLVDFALRFAAHLPRETAPATTESIAEPAGIGRGPMYRQPVAYHEVSMLVRLYEQALDAASSAIWRSLDKSSGAERDALVQICRDMARVRLRLAGYFDAQKADFFGRTDPGKVATSARTLSANITRQFGQ